MVENGAGRRIAQFGRFSWFCSEPSKMSDAPTGTILDHFVGWGRSRAVWTCRRCDTHAKTSKCTRLYLQISPTISQRSRSTSGDRPPISSNLPRFRHTKRALMHSGACESHLRHVHTARDRPHSTKWSRMVPVGASLSLVDFHMVLIGFARNRTK